VNEPAAGTVSFAEYLASERTSEVKHEWLAGTVFAMAGGTIEHGALAAAVIRDLGLALLGRPCRVLTSDVRVRVLATGLCTYADVVVCGTLETDPEDQHTVTNPILVVEVLSDSTEAYDRGKKFAQYRRIPSLREYVLVSQYEPRIEVYRRTERGPWELSEAGARGAVELLSASGPPIHLDVDRVYQDPLAPQSA
jgi:Uma2 family endonuclease